jgi:predicted small lipoprotein YifL
MKKRKVSSTEDAVDSQRAQRKELTSRAHWRRAVFLRDLLAAFASPALSSLKLTLVVTLAVSIAGCGTKTELLKPDGKPTARDERDPSQPPNPLSR